MLIGSDLTELFQIPWASYESPTENPNLFLDVVKELSIGRVFGNFIARKSA